MSFKITRHAGDTYVAADAEKATEAKEESWHGNSSLTFGEQPAKKDEKKETVNPLRAALTENRSKKVRKDSSSVRSVEDDRK